jgi:outer membrane protein
MMVVFSLFPLIVCSTDCSAEGSASGTGGVIRFGAMKVIPQDSSGELSGLPLLPGVKTDVLDTASVILSYEQRLSEFFSIEFIGGLPPKFDFAGAGTLASIGLVGQARAVSPTVVLNLYPFGRDMLFRPHVGAGVTYTNFIDEKPAPALEGFLGPTDLALKSFVAPIFKVGADVELGQSWMLSFSASYAFARSSATLTSAGVAREIDVRLDPVILFVGLGYEF